MLNQQIDISTKPHPFQKLRVITTFSPEVAQKTPPGIITIKENGPIPPQGTGPSPWSFSRNSQKRQIFRFLQLTGQCIYTITPKAHQDDARERRKEQLQKMTVFSLQHEGRRKSDD